MKTIDARDVKTNFVKLVDAAAAMETIVIAKACKSTARLVPTQRDKVVRSFGRVKGKLRIADGFDASLPDRVTVAFTGH